MSLDKLVDSTQLDSDLTSVANAIRAKTGGSGSLAFPSGFVSAVEAIPTGGGGLEYDLKTVNVTNNTPKVDRAFTNFLFFAQIDSSDIPAAADRARLHAYMMLFAYVNGEFLVSDGGRGLVASTQTAGASAIKTVTSGMSNTSVDNTSITFSTWTSHYMQTGSWQVLQIELPDDMDAYAFSTVA